MAVQFADICHWLYKLSICGTSEWTVGTPMPGTGPALAAVVFVGTGTWRLGRAGVYSASIAPMVGPCVGHWVLEPDISGSAPTDLHWWLCEHCA